METQRMKLTNVNSEQTVYILGNTTEDTGYCVESLSSNLVENLMFL
ncbi:unnamed protein product [Brassica oleracea]